MNARFQLRRSQRGRALIAPVALATLGLVCAFAALALGSGASVVGATIAGGSALAAFVGASYAWIRASGPVRTLCFEGSRVRLEAPRSRDVVAEINRDEMSVTRKLYVTSERSYETATLWTRAHPVVELALGDERIGIGTQAGSYGWAEDAPETGAPDYWVDIQSWPRLVTTLGLEHALGRDRLTMSLGPP